MENLNLTESKDELIAKISELKTNGIISEEESQNIMVDGSGTVANLDLHISSVFIEKISRHSNALRFPVKPDTERCVMNDIALDHGINGGVEFDAADLIPDEFKFHADIIDVVVFHVRINTAEMSDNTVLTAFLLPFCLP